MNNLFYGSEVETSKGERGYVQSYWKSHPFDKSPENSDPRKKMRASLVEQGCECKLHPCLPEHADYVFLSKIARYIKVQELTETGNFLSSRKIEDLEEQHEIFVDDFWPFIWDVVYIDDKGKTLSVWDGLPDKKTK